MNIFSTKKADEAPPEALAEAPAPLTLRDAAPEWVKISDKLKELCARDDEIIGEMRPMANRLARAGYFNTFDASTIPIPKEDPRPIEASAAAAALLGELTPEPRMPPEPFHQPKTRDPEANRFEELAREQFAVREAIAHLRDVPNGERYSALTKAHLRGSKEFCKQIEPEYAPIAVAYCDALLDLGRATAARNKFVEERLCGVRWGSLRPIRLANALGNPLNPTSELRRVLAWAAENGRFDLAELPEEWVTSGRPIKAMHEILNENER